jgi:hypothetical protein
MEDKVEVRKLLDGSHVPPLEGTEEQTRFDIEEKTQHDHPALHGEEFNGSTSLQNPQGYAPVAPLLHPFRGEVPDGTARGRIGLRQALIFLVAFAAGIVLSCAIERPKLKYTTIDRQFQKETKK